MFMNIKQHKNTGQAPNGWKKISTKFCPSRKLQTIRKLITVVPQTSHTFIL